MNEGVVNMTKAYNFNPLWKKLIDLNMTKTELAEKSGLSISSLMRMRHGIPISLTNLDRICEVLECNLDDIMEVHNIDDA